MKHFLRVRIYLTLMAGILYVNASCSPLTIQPRFTNSFRFTSTDVWNIDVQYTGASNINVYFLATVSIGSSKVCTVKSGTLLLTPGTQTFTSASINTVLLNYHTPAIGDIENITGSFPSGTYKICYNAFCITSNCGGLGSNLIDKEYPNCFEIMVEPPTPLLLAFPEDHAELEWKRPTFNWITPMPLGSVNGFNYLYTLVEASKGQSCPDAITRNRPLYKQSGIEQPTLPYPAELNDLDTGKVYCWKVDGLVSDIPVAQSEVWTFKLKPEEIKKKKSVIVQLNYLGQESPLPCVVHFDDTLRVQYTQEYFGITEEWQITLQSLDQNKNINIDDKALTAKYNGTGEIVFNAEDLSQVKEGVVYVIKVFSEKNEILAARIVFKNE